MDKPSDQVRFERFEPAQLGEFIKNRYKKGKDENFVTFLFGSGCSKSAGIPLAGEIAKELRAEAPTHPFLRDAGDPPEETSEYAFLMEKLGSPWERAKRVKKFIDHARDEKTRRLRVNWAHLLLATMVEKGYINRILTTNFDPLIVEALALTGQPIQTYDLSTTGRYDPGTLDPPSVIYLHGQMHSLLLANSDPEKERLKTLYQHVLLEALQESLLIVVGYSGDRDPVLKSMSKLATFPCGLWWSHYGGELGEDVKQLFTDEKFRGDCHLAEGYDADRFMCELVLDGIKLELPAKVLDPIVALRQELERFTAFPPGGPKACNPLEIAIERVKHCEKCDAESRFSVASQIATAVMVGEWKKFHELRTQVPRNTKDLYSRAVGDGLLVHASELVKDQPDEAIGYLEEVESYGFMQKNQVWLSTLWGDAMTQQARLKGTPDGDSLFEEAVENYAEAARIKPDQPEVFNNWGYALSEQAKIKGDTPRGDHLFAQAGEKYLEALRLKPDYHEAFCNWGAALFEQAKIKGNRYEEEHRLFAQAEEKYAAALKIKPDYHMAFSNWGNALLEQAKIRGNTDEGDQLFAEAEEKYAAALKIKPDYHVAFCNWGNALLEQAKIRGNTGERDRLFAEAGQKYATALRIKPDYHGAFCNWGVALSYQANLKGNTPEGDRLFTEAGKKYAEAARIKPDMHEAFYNWGIALIDQAKLKGNTPEGDRLFTEAGKKYAEAVGIKPDYHDAFNNWGIALSDQAKIKGNTPEGDRLFAQAGEKYAEAARVKPDDHTVFCNWGTALLNQAKLKGNRSEEGGRLLVQAGKKYAEALRIKPDMHEAHFNLGCMCALQGDSAKAVGHLESWRKYCPTASQSKLDEETDFDPIRDTEEFRKFRNTLPPVS